MRGRNLRRTLVAAGLVAASAVLVLVLAVAGLLAFIVTSAGAGSSWNVSMDELSAALVRTEGGYAFTGGEYLAEKELWAMLVDEGGAVVWQQGKPADVPDRYSLTDVAAFTRWYLSDYPVQVRVREDGLLVAGGPKGSTWKHPFVLDRDVLKTIPFWFAGLFLLALLGVLGLTALVLGRQFRREQQERDFARSDWINGISHDIRTPLSMVMGYAGQLHGQDGGNEAGAEDAVGNPSAEPGGTGHGLVDMGGVQIAGDTGEEVHVGLADGLGVAGAVAQLQLLNGHDAASFLYALTGIRGTGPRSGPAPERIPAE